MLSSLVFYLLDNPSKLSRLQQELEEAEKRSEEGLKYRDFRELPYLVRTVYQFMLWMHPF